MSTAYGTARSPAWRRSASTCCPSTTLAGIQLELTTPVVQDAGVWLNIQRMP